MNRIRTSFTAALAAVFALTLVLGAVAAAPAETDAESEIVVIGKVQHQDFHFT